MIFVGNFRGRQQRKIYKKHKNIIDFEIPSMLLSCWVVLSYMQLMESKYYFWKIIQGFFCDYIDT